MDITGFFNTITGGDLLRWKVIGTTVVFLLAGTQVFLAARMYRASTVPPVSEASASISHRWLGRVTLTLAIVVAITCIAGPAGPVSPPRVLFHSIFGTVVLLTIAAKFTILRVLQRGEKLLPVVGTTLFLCFGALWVTSVADYVSR